MEEPQAGQVISPQPVATNPAVGQAVPPPVPLSTPEAQIPTAPAPVAPVLTTPPAPIPESNPEPPAAVAAVSDPVVAPAEQTLEPQAEERGWQYNQEDSGTASASPVQPITDEIRWTASEFIAHDKSPSWYGALAVGAVVVAGLAYLVTKDKISTGVILFAAIAFGAFAGRKPQTQQYELSRHGVQIGTKVYTFQSFKTFAVNEEGAIVSIVFMPLKRFMPPLSIYVAPDMEKRVIDFLSAFLPVSQHKTDAIDGLLSRIRF